MTGIRPGEKIHEIMVSEEEAYRTVERGEWYGILPMLPEVLGEPKLAAGSHRGVQLRRFRDDAGRDARTAAGPQSAAGYDPQADPAKAQMEAAFSGEMLR